MSHKTRLKSATDAAKEGQKFCKTFKFEISADEVDFPASVVESTFI